MSEWTKQLGDVGEDFAANFLTSKGYEILDRNFRYGREAEVDIIAKQNDLIVFVEVKTRFNDKLGRPAEAVNYPKQQRIILAAKKYLQDNYNFDTPCRFDVIEILANDKMNSRSWKINHIENAFEVNQRHKKIYF
ncbi:MAG: YraN family protein [Selenomonadaceae bacterium]|nr:YraN family protein [Selenomonadaceae bacterium]